MPSRVETEAKLLTMYRTLRLVGVPYTLPGTPKDRVIILQDVMLTPEDMDKAIRELPREPRRGRAFQKAGRRRSTAAAVTQTNKDLSSVARADD